MARLPEEEIQRRFQENLELCRISDEDALMRWPDLDEAERARRRNLAEGAAARCATIVDDETGQRLLGGRQPAHNQKVKKSIVEVVVDLADGDRQREVLEALFAPLHDSSSAVRGKGAERIINIKLAHEEEQRKDREELRKLGRDELIARLAKGMLESGMMGEVLAKIGRELPEKTFDGVGSVAEDEEAA